MSRNRSSSHTQSLLARARARPSRLASARGFVSFHALASAFCRPLPSAHPAVQHEAIPNAMLGMDVLCQAKSGMGKTAVFVLSTLNQINADAASGEGGVAALVLCHTRELAHQIAQEFKRFRCVLCAA